MTKQLKSKKKGPIRFEAIIPVAIISTLTFTYFTYYFDNHLKNLFEYVGTQANGAEVNIDSIKTSLLRGSFNIDRIQVTAPDNPTHNSIEIGNIHFKFVWDALLRMKFVVDDASISNIQLVKPRKKPGMVLPPKPAAPSKMEEIQNQVFAQVKNKYNANMLGDIVTILDGGDYKDQLQTIRETLKSESRAKEMVSEVNTKKDYWDKKVKELSDTSKIKEIESLIKSSKSEKNLVNQAQNIKKASELFKDIEKQYKEIEKSSNDLQSQLKTISNYPKELQTIVNEDIANLKNRFKVPQLDFKDMAMHLFAGEFAQHIAKAKKYQALADQYLPEKKTDENVVIPPKRSEGKNYHFPITTGYPLFWLKRAAISSKGTAESYSGQVSGELTNLTTSPKLIKKPVVLDMRGDFPSAQILGVKAIFSADFTQDISKQNAVLEIKSFKVPEKTFVKNDQLQFGFLNAEGFTSINATFQENNLQMTWVSALSHPEFKVETNNKIAKEMLTNIVNNIPLINIKGSVEGTFSNFDMKISSNLGEELQSGFSREIGVKINEAQSKIDEFIQNKISTPKTELMSALGGSNDHLKKLSSLKDFYKKHEKEIKAEIEKLKKGGGAEQLKQKGKDLLKKFKI